VGRLVGRICDYSDLDVVHKSLFLLRRYSDSPCTSAERRD